MDAGPESGPAFCAHAQRRYADPVEPEPVAPGIVAVSLELLGRVDRLAAELAELIRTGEPAYADTELVDFADLSRSCRGNLEFVFAHLAGRDSPGPEAAWQTGLRRAEQGVPLPTVLRAYRIGGRFMWQTLRDAWGAHPDGDGPLLDASAQIWTLIDVLSEGVADSFRESAADRARRDTQVRIALLERVFSGSVMPGPDLTRTAEALRMPPDGQFVAVCAERSAPGDDALSPVEQELRTRGVASVWRWGEAFEVGIVALRPRFTETALARQIEGIARARVGLSVVFTRLDQAPTGLRQATVACTAGAASSREIVRYDAGSVAMLLAAQPAAAGELAHAVLGPVLAQPAGDRAALLATLRAWYAHGASPTAAAAHLHVHRNTVRYRLHRVEELTGLSLADPVGAATVYVALDAIRMLGADFVDPPEATQQQVGNHSGPGPAVGADANGCAPEGATGDVAGGPGDR